MKPINPAPKPTSMPQTASEKGQVHPQAAGMHTQQVHTRKNLVHNAHKDHAHKDHAHKDHAHKDHAHKDHAHQRQKLNAKMAPHHHQAIPEFPWRQLRSESIQLKFHEVLSLMFALVFLLYTITGDWLIRDMSSLEVNKDLIVQPFQNFNNLLGTDIYGRSILDVWLAGFSKTYIIGVIAILIHVFLTVPITIFMAYRHAQQEWRYNRQSYLATVTNKLLEPLMLFPSLFVFCIFAGIYGTTLFGIFFSIFISTLIYVSQHTYKTVTGIMSLPIISTFRLEGANFWQMLKMVIFPLLVRQQMRVLRRVFLLAISEAMMIAVINVRLQPDSYQWGTLLRISWLYRESIPYALFISAFLMSFALFVASVTFDIAERYIVSRLALLKEFNKKRRAASLRQSHFQSMQE